MKKDLKVYLRLESNGISTETEHAFLTSSIIEVDTAVTVEDFHNGFDQSSFSDGFEVNFE